MFRPYNNNSNAIGKTSSSILPHTLTKSKQAFLSSSKTSTALSPPQPQESQLKDYNVTDYPGVPLEDQYSISIFTLNFISSQSCINLTITVIISSLVSLNNVQNEDYRHLAYIIVSPSSVFNDSHESQIFVGYSFETCKAFICIIISPLLNPKC